MAMLGLIPLAYCFWGKADVLTELKIDVEGGLAALEVIHQLLD